MAKYSNTVEYNIRTTLDTSGVTKLQAQLTQLQNQVKILGAKELMPAHQVSNTLTKIKQIQNALTQAFNPKLGMLNTSAFMKNLQQAGLSMNGIYQTFSKVGPAGERAFASMYGQISKIDTGMRSVSKTTDKIMNTFGNTVRWGIIASAFASVMRAVHGAAQYVSDLDKSLTNIQMVTASARDTMNDFAVQANKVAQRLGGTTVQMTNATEVFIRQGYDLATSTQLGEYAVHLANVSGQDSAMASDEITAYMNAFKIPLEDLGNAVSKWAAVANNAAVSVEELSVASQKAAAVATTVGVDMDQFAAHIAAIEATTREAPENIGNGLKTIYSRIADVKLGETLEDGVDLGSFAKAIEKVGVQVLDSTGSLRDAGDILQDLMVVWQDLDQTQRAAVAKTVAGRFQLARFEALMNSADIYQKALTTSQAETGTTTYDRMQETYRNSLEGRSKALQASVEEIFLNVFTTDSFYGFIDAAQAVVDIFNKLVKAAGGGEAALTGLLIIMTKMGQNTLSRGISNFIVNRQSQQATNQNIQNAQAMAAAQLQGKGLTTTNARLNTFANDTAKVQQYAPMMNDEQIRKSNELIEQRVQILNQLSAAEQQQKTAETQLRAAIAAIAPELNLESEALLRQIEAWERDGIAVETTSQEFNNLRQRLFSSAEAVTGFTETLWQIKDGALQNEQALQWLGDRAWRLSETLHGLAASGVLAGEELISVAKAEELLKRISTENITTQDGLVRALEKVGTTLTEVNSALARAPQHMRQIIQSHDEASSAATRLATAEKEVAGAQKFMEHGLNLQKISSGFVDLTGAAMSTVFAFQSLKGIITAINDDNMTLADKVEQITMNIVMLAALGIPAIQQSVQAVQTLREGWAAYSIEQTLINQNVLAAQAASSVAQAGSSQALYTALREEALAQHVLNEAKIESIAISQGTTVEKVKEAMGVMGLVAAEEAQIKEEEKLKAVQILTNNIAKTKVGQLYLEILAKLGLIKVDKDLAASEIAVAVAAKIAQMGIKGILLAAAPLAAVAGIFVAIAAGVKYFSDQEEARKQALQANIDASNEAVAAIKENSEKLKNLYAEYTNSRKASDEFKNALLEQAKALGIVNAEQMIALGAYPDLIKQINEATAAQLAYNTALLQQQNKTTFGPDVSEELQEKAGVNSHNELTSAGNIRALDDSRFTRLLKYEQEVIELQQELGKLNQQKMEINHNNDLTDQQRIDALKEIEQRENNINKALSEYTSILSNDNNKKYLENARQIVDNQRTAALLDENSVLHSGDKIESYLGKGNTTLDSIEELESLITQGAFGKEIQEYFQGLGPEAARAFLLSFGQEINKADLGLNADNLKFVSAMNVAGAKYGKAAVARGTVESQEGAQTSFEDILTGKKSSSLSSDFFDLTDREKATIVLGIDATKTESEIIHDINKIIERINNGESLYEIFPNVEVESDEEILANKVNGRGDQDWDRDAEAVKKYADELQDLADTSDNVADSLDENRRAAIRIADANARMNKGLETLAKNWEKWSDVLSNPDAYEGTAEYAEALEGTKSTVEDILDLDLSTFENSTKFIEDNMSDIAAAADGDIDAIERLRMSAEQQILVDAGIDLNNMNEDVAAFQDLIAGTNFDDIEIGATLDDIGFTDALLAMQESANMSTEEIQRVLNSLGFEPEITYVEATVGDTDEATGLTTYTYTDDQGKEHTVQMKSEVAQVTDGKVKIPIINGSKTTYQGSAGSSVNAGNRGGSGKGGGGGGGGGSKAKSVDQAKGATSTVDPYNEVNATLEELADAYTEVDKAKDRMYGDRYRRASEEEIKNLQKQNEQLEKRVEISEKIKEAMLTGQDNSDYGIYLEGESLAKYGLTDLDDNGRIDNYIDAYNQARAAQEAAKQAMDDYWNSLGGEMDDAQQERYKELEEAQKEAAEYANKITEITNKYQETCDKIRDDTQQIQDNMYEIEDKIIDIWNYAKDAAKELGEFREEQIDLAETLATLWGDDAVKSLGFAFDRFTNMFEANEKSLADAIIDYQNRLSKATDENMKQWYQDQIDLAQKAMTNGTSVLDLNMQRMNDIYKAIDEWKESGVSELFGSNEKAMWEAFDEAWEDAVDYAKKLKGYIEDIHDNIGQVMDDMYDAMDRRNDLFDQVESQYEYLKDMTELVHGEKAYDMLERITRKQAQAGEERLKTLEEERKANHDMLEGLEEGSEEYLKALEKEQELDDNIRDIRKDITDTYKEAKELANELAVQNWLDNFTADINGVEVPLEYAADQWERIKENADNYLDDLNRAWELEKLENEYLKLIDDAVDPNIQKQITKQMEEQLGYLREKDKLSEYDVKYANAQLEILQKTIALEDARANKNQMKLRRDSQGNYSYVYAANRNDVRDKENDLLDARMNGYNMSVEASTDATDRYLQKVQSMADQLRDVANDQNLSKEQIAAITQDIIDQGYDFLDAMGEQLTTAQRNGIESYIQAAQALSELNAGNVLDVSQQLQNGMIDDLGVVTDVFHTAVKDWVDGESGLAFFRDEIDQTGRDIVRNIDDFVIAVGEANTNIEEPLSGIETQFIDANDALTRLTSSAEGFYNFLEEKSGIVGQAAADLAEYQAALTDMNSKMNEYYDAWEQRGKELESEKAINSQLRIDMSNLQEEYEAKLAEAQRQAGQGGSRAGSSSSTDKSNGSVVGYSGRYYSDSWGSGPSGNWFADQPGAVRISSFSRRSGYGDYNVHLETLNGGHLGWVKESQLFDTGGYTGAWGPGGKAAILHEKELVLNAQDTQNMLAAVSVVRGLVEMLKGSTFNLNNMSQRGFTSSGIGNNVEQRVEITAEFPNVRSAADIEAALLNLSNNAYQYAYNKNEKFM